MQLWGCVHAPQQWRWILTRLIRPGDRGLLPDAKGRVFPSASLCLSGATGHLHFLACRGPTPLTTAISQVCLWSWSCSRWNSGSLAWNWSSFARSRADEVETVGFLLANAWTLPAELYRETRWDSFHSWPVTRGITGGASNWIWDSCGLWWAPLEGAGEDSSGLIWTFWMRCLL